MSLGQIRRDEIITKNRSNTRTYLRQSSDGRLLLSYSRGLLKGGGVHDKSTVRVNTPLWGIPGPNSLNKSFPEIFLKHGWVRLKIRQKLLKIGSFLLKLIIKVGKWVPF